MEDASSPVSVPTSYPVTASMDDVDSALLETASTAIESAVELDAAVCKLGGERLATLAREAEHELDTTDAGFIPMPAVDAAIAALKGEAVTNRRATATLLRQIAELRLFTAREIASHHTHANGYLSAEEIALVEEFNPFVARSEPLPGEPLPPVEEDDEEDEVIEEGDV